MVDSEVNEIVADTIKINKCMIIIMNLPLKLTGEEHGGSGGDFVRVQGRDR